MARGKSRYAEGKTTPTGEHVTGAGAPSGDELCSCVLCDLTISGNVLPCKVCKANYHPACVNITDEVYGVLITILPVVGWVCPECITSIAEKRKTIDTQFQQLFDAVNKLQQDYATLAAKANSATPVVNQHQPVTNISHTVSQVVKDQLRRKKNVIISG